MLRADDGKHAGVREDVRVLRVGDCTADAQASKITCVLLLDYVSAFTRSAKAHAVDVRTHQNRRHIFKTAFSTSYRPQYAAEAGRANRKRLSQMSSCDLRRSIIPVLVTTYQGYLGRLCIHLASTFRYDKRGRVTCWLTRRKPFMMLRRCASDVSGPIVGAGGNGG